MVESSAYCRQVQFGNESFISATQRLKSNDPKIDSWIQNERIAALNLYKMGSI